MNIYWPVFKNLEAELESLLYSIHLDDTQLKVYSSKISDLLLRSAAEIESISKELYHLNGGKKEREDFLRFEEAIKYLNQIWSIEKKAVLLSSYNCFLTNRTIKPFVKDTIKTGKKKKTYKWNNAYQNIKHNRFESIEYGNLENLISALAGLYILNIYFKDEKYHLGKDMSLSDFDLGMGSKTFSITYHKEKNFTHLKDYLKGENFEESIYLILPDKYLYGKMKETLAKIEAKRKEIILSKVKTIIDETTKEDSLIKFDKTKFNFSETQLPAIKQYASELFPRTLNMRYDFELNKNQV